MKKIQKKFLWVMAVPVLALSIIAVMPVKIFAEQVDSTVQSVDFGSVPINSTNPPSQTLTFTNSTGNEISINQVRAGSDSNPEFTVTDQNCNSQTLANGQSCNFTVTFNPDQVKSFTGQAVILYDTATNMSPQYNSAGFGLTGSGVASDPNGGGGGNGGGSGGGGTSTPPSGGGRCDNSGVVSLGSVSSLFFAQYCSATEAITTAIKWLMILIGMVSAMFIIWGGFQYITSAGNSESAEKGQKTITNAAIGLAVAILAYTIVAIISNTLANVK